MRYLTLIFLFIGFSISAISQNFVETPFSSTAQGFLFSAMSFGDIDNDGDLDMIASGSTDPTILSIIYLNDGNNNFVESNNSILEPLFNNSVLLFDSDNDDDLDLLLSGTTVGSSPLTIYYLNDGAGNYSLVSDANFINVEFSHAASSDVDNDGDLDVLIIGYDGNVPITNLYLNDGSGGFTSDTNNNFQGVDEGDIEFVDVDNDGDEDVFISGWISTVPEPSTNLYINDGSGNFMVQSDLGIINVLRSALVTLDADGDNDQDLIISGIDASNNNPTKFYLNDGNGIFTESTESTFAGIAGGDVISSDVDKDGDIDVLLSGVMPFSITSQSLLYLNDGNGVFELDNLEVFDGFTRGQSEFVDFDDDGDEDLFMMGLNQSLTAIHKLYENQLVVSSTTTAQDIEDHNVLIYPNLVAEDLLNIKITSKKIGEAFVTLTDLQGRVINSFRFPLNSAINQFQIEEIPDKTGSYFVNIIVDGKTFTQKIIVAK